MSDLVRTFEIPGLATVNLDTRDNRHPALEIRLDPSYHGDLNDLLEDRADGTVYLACNESSAVNNYKLARFMEVLTQWDYTGDGVPDCKEIVEAIELALYLSQETPDEFKRPAHGWYARMLMRFMPPAPPYQIVLSFGQLKARFRWYHYVGALPMIVVVLGLVLAQIHYLPWTGLSVLTGVGLGVGTIAKLLGLSNAVTTVLTIVLVAIIVNRTFANSKSSGPSPMSRFTYGFLNKAAVVEEQTFREGAENWTAWERTRSCLIFGAVHMTNLIYPLATILPLALGGALFMFVYLRSIRKNPFRRTAVLKAAVWHRVYNRIALAVALGSVILTVGYWAFGLFALVALYWGVTALRSRNRETKQQRTQVAASTAIAD